MADAAVGPGPRAAWHDLALNQPGQATRAYADALHAVWRRRSWWARRTTRRTAELETRRLAEGQVQLAKQLSRLGAGWKVLHQVPAGPDQRGVDHLLVGPGGVFTVNSRHHAKTAVRLGGGTLMVDGERVHHVRDSRADADAVSAALSAAVGFDVPVTGLVIIIGDNRFDVRCQPDDVDVQVTTPRAGLRWLRQRGVAWTSYGVDRIYAAARKSTTWQTEQPSDDGDEATDASDRTTVRGHHNVPVVDMTRAAS